MSVNIKILIAENNGIVAKDLKKILEKFSSEDQVSHQKPSKRL